MTVEIEDLISEGAPERRVDSPKLLLFLSQLNTKIEDLENCLKMHMEAEERNQAKIADLIEMLMSFKGFIKVLKIISIFSAKVGAVITFLIGLYMTFKEHIK